ncbi:nucleoid occlusion protein [Pseudogracilibacillus auburnensis]|uniref:nucleoid occlusion protein n=1 Tax=Pseudogracilibacillus auburnensis TaxID=1494959 RepID=UPI001A97690C|nr:nucleoid occlusion protein [Pseudogracilibacillus auburnensis]MBO1004164.1 nucleoid occlusion protein [Pseudogracilibacillus auburnensis]
MLQSFNRLFTSGSKSEEQADSYQEDVVQLNVDQIIPNEYQPRTQFDNEKIKELAQTLQTHGMIQPIVVRVKNDEQYEVIAGERRLRAAKLLGWETISAIIRNLNDTETASIALIENIQREELSVIEEAKAYAQLIKMHSLTQEALAQRLGKSQSTIANRIRLLMLPDVIQQALIVKEITERHARALMKLKDEKLQIDFYNKIIEKQLNVRETDELIKDFLSDGKTKKKIRPKSKFISKDVRIATNTIRRSLKMIADTGINVESEEEELDDYYQITIRVKKTKHDKKQQK